MDPVWKRIMTDFHMGDTKTAEEALLNWNRENPLPFNSVRLKKKYRSQ